MQILTQLVFSGIALGMIYAVIAFGYQLTFATSDTLNFGQGEALMLGALVGLTLVGMGVNYWLMIPIVCVFGAIQGAVVERIGVRPAIKIKSEFGWIMSTIALGIIFKNVAENVWGHDDLKFPSPLPESPIRLLGANVLPMELLVIVGQEDSGLAHCSLPIVSEWGAGEEHPAGRREWGAPRWGSFPRTIDSPEREVYWQK